MPRSRNRRQISSRGIPPPPHRTHLRLRALGRPRCSTHRRRGRRCWRLHQRPTRRTMWRRPRQRCSACSWRALVGARAQRRARCRRRPADRARLAPNGGLGRGPESPDMCAEPPPPTRWRMARESWRR
eukprot:scaffold4916_cov28-Tisochrysis_lutea.AAC.5